MIKNNIRSVAIAIVIFYLSITEGNNIKAPRLMDIPNIDKIGHFGMYFTLMFVIVYEHMIISERKRNIYFLGLIPFLYGLTMELFQELLTKSRGADFFDILFNASGIIAATVLWKYLFYFKAKRLN